MITATEWEAFLDAGPADHFRDEVLEAFDKFAVPQAEQVEIKAIVASTRADIVV
jgi:hypothetical protein